MARRAAIASSSSSNYLGPAPWHGGAHDASSCPSCRVTTTPAFARGELAANADRKEPDQMIQHDREAWSDLHGAILEEHR